jgi:hypothetical protein
MAIENPYHRKRMKEIFDSLNKKWQTKIINGVEGNSTKILEVLKSQHMSYVIKNNKSGKV